MNTEQLEVSKLLIYDWEIAIPDTLSEEVLIQLLAKRVAYLIERSPEQFFQLMYRLDISEQKLNEALVNDNASLEIAKIIYNRQLMKVRSRQVYKQSKNCDDADLKW